MLRVARRYVQDKVVLATHVKDRDDFHETLGVAAKRLDAIAVVLTKANEDHGLEADAAGFTGYGLMRIAQHTGLAKASNALHATGRC